MYVCVCVYGGGGDAKADNKDFLQPIKFTFLFNICLFLMNVSMIGVFI